jgi:hypothetical protein
LVVVIIYNLAFFTIHSSSINFILIKSNKIKEYISINLLPKPSHTFLISTILTQHEIHTLV